MKEGRSVSTLVWILKLRAAAGLNDLGNYNFIWAAGYSHEQMAEVLTDSALLIFLGMEEGFGLLPLEAALSGCLVVAFDLAPVTRFLPKEYRHRPLDFKGMVSSIETLLGNPKKKNRLREKLIAKAHRSALKFSLEEEKKSLLKAWSKILGVSLG